MNIYDAIADNPTINLRLHDSPDNAENKPDMNGKLSSTMYL